MKDVTVNLTGNLVASYVELLEQDLAKNVEEGLENLTIDFTECVVVDSVGIGLLVKTLNMLKPKGGGVTVINLNPDIVKMFEMMHLDKHIEIR
jgi:anti-anti-sigma factor